nr:MAG TPA: hypothetical protein [Caudoviricetes sp.]
MDGDKCFNACNSLKTTKKGIRQDILYYVIL